MIDHNQDDDIYTAYASMLLDIPMHDVVPEHRTKAKQLLFKHNYIGYTNLFVPDIELRLVKCKDQLELRKAYQRPTKKLEGMIEALEGVLEDFS